MQPSCHCLGINPTQDNTVLIKAAKSALRRGFRAGYQYQKAGVMLLDLIQPEERQFDLLSPVLEIERDKLMTTIDALNKKSGLFW